MITLIIGGQGSGKTTTAKKITEGKKTVWMQQYEILTTWGFMNVEKDTEFIVIEEATEKHTVDFFTVLNKLVIQKPCDEGFVIDMPKIIITSNTLTRADWESWESENIELIEL